jgi:hypothetical protein
MPPKNKRVNTKGGDTEGKKPPDMAQLISEQLAATIPNIVAQVSESLNNPLNNDDGGRNNNNDHLNP